MENKDLTIILMGLVILGLIGFMIYKNNPMKITQFTRDSSGRIIEILER